MPEGVKTPIYLIDDDDINIYKSQVGGDGPSSYCDRSGTVWTADEVAYGEEDLKKKLFSSGLVIAEFKNESDLIYFASDIVECSRAEKWKHLGMPDFNKEMNKFGWSDEERLNLVKAYQKFFGEPHPPLNPPLAKPTEPGRPGAPRIKGTKDPQND